MQEDHQLKLVAKNKLLAEAQHSRLFATSEFLINSGVCSGELRQRPPRMFCDERFRVVRRLCQRGQVRNGPGVTKCHADIAQESAPFDARDGRSPEKLAERLFVERKQLARGKAHRIPGGIRGFDGRLREPVPRAGGGAGVATVNAPADERTERLGDAPLVFDGQVGDATPRVWINANY